MQVIIPTWVMILYHGGQLPHVPKMNKILACIFANMLTFISYLSLCKRILNFLKLTFRFAPNLKFIIDFFLITSLLHNMIYKHPGDSSEYICQWTI
jgi:hypothetical protein